MDNHLKSFVVIAPLRNKDDLYDTSFWPNNVGRRTNNANRTNYNLRMVAAPWKAHVENVTAMCDNFYSHLYEIIDESSVLRYASNASSSFPPWFSIDIVKTLKHKHNVRKKWLKNWGLAAIEWLMRRIINTPWMCRTTLNTLFWRYLNQKNQSCAIPGQMVYDNRRLSTPTDIVNALAEYFGSVYDWSDGCGCSQNFILFSC